MFADYHVHTEFSDDSVYPMESVVQDAIQMGMDEICFTDHVDYGVKDDWNSGVEIRWRGNEPFANVDYPAYMEEIRRMQEKYSSSIRIRTGLEFGMQTHTIPQYEALFARYPFDFIILSVHQIENKEFWTQDFQQGRSQKEYNERYYQELLALVRNYKNYSVLMPSEEILRLYLELGGTILTIGSDSHKPEQLGAYIMDTRKRLKELGFQSFCTYERMKPAFHDL